ncbi:MAG TPA: DUF3857 domain-containing protein [Candidatus Angelobacter sp.]|nr:DUF3857 domain-containing protein [Candidatus Angelobacter sp.]
MKLLSLLLLFTASVCVPAFAADRHESRSDQALVTSFSKLDIDSARKEAEQILARDPRNSLALFVRMEVAELEAQTGAVLDSALRLCRTQAPRSVQEVASARVLVNAGNTQAFRQILHNLRAAARQENDCAFNLRMALVAAAADGDSTLNLEQAAASAGLLTRWRMAGPFGRYSNADFDSRWEPESDRFSHAYYGKRQTEEFLFRDGFVRLPDYFLTPGILYAASDLELSQPQTSLLEVLGPGPYAVFLDGKLVLTHDTRYIAAASRDSIELKLNSGKHRVMVKFNEDAAPFRVAIHAEGKTTPTHEFGNAFLDRYIEGLLAYFREDLPALDRISRSDSSRTGKYLRALLYSSIEGHSSEARALWETLAAVPLAQTKLAEIAAESGEPSHKLSGLAKALPDSEAAQQASFELFRDENSLERLMALHPSCAHLSQALKFFYANGDQAGVMNVEKQLAFCAPESLLYPETLSAVGRHAEAAEYLQGLLAANPLERSARRMLIQELLLDGGHGKEAKDQAQRLHEIAPNSLEFSRFALMPSEVLDSSSGRRFGFVQQEQFYVPYRRNGLKIIRQSTERHFSGGPSVTLLADKVVAIQPDGSLSVYTHRITRLLNKDGIARYGEVSIPRGADLLELRTVKPNGQVIEPELALQKPTVSMPALEPGDSVEEEFVVHSADWDQYSSAATDGDDAPSFSFGSFTAPILYSRFVVIAPENLPVDIAARNGALHPHVEHSGGNVIQSWEKNDIQQTALENNLPPGNQFPTVAVVPLENSRARLRDELIATTHIGLQTQQIAQSIQDFKQTDYENARRLYRFVTSRIQSSADWSANNAEDTLLNSEGSRTAALLSLARATGLKAALLLAHKIGQSCHGDADFPCYNHPLVRFWFTQGKVVDADAESDGLSFGAVPSGLDTADALLVPLSPEADSNLRVSLMRSIADEKSIGEANLFLDENGSLSADLRIRLGASRGQQVRSLLESASERERQIFFDQLAIRIFPGATQVTGLSQHVNDPEQPLELSFHCQVPQLVNPEGPWQIDQLVPALGLRDVYAKNATRKFPLYIDSLLFENTTFHLRLAPNLRLRSLPPGFTLRTEFGDYSVRFNSAGQQVTIHREFQIPVQIIAPRKYEGFVNFAQQVDDAERGRIVLEATKELARSGQSK